jgi:hypothetical protein
MIVYNQPATYWTHTENQRTVLERLKLSNAVFMAYLTEGHYKIPKAA